MPIYVNGEVFNYSFRDGTDPNDWKDPEGPAAPSLTAAQAARLNGILDQALDGRLRALGRLDVERAAAAAHYIDLSVTEFSEAALIIYRAAGRGRIRGRGRGKGAWRGDLFDLFVELGENRPLGLAVAVAEYATRLNIAWDNKRLKDRLYADNEELGDRIAQAVGNLGRAAAIGAAAVAAQNLLKKRGSNSGK